MQSICQGQIELSLEHGRKMVSPR